MKKLTLPIFLFLILPFFLLAQTEVSEFQDEIFWETNPGGSIVWDLSEEQRLPHGDNIEMSGQKVAGIIHYSLDEDKMLKVTRHIIYPQLRVFIGSNESKWRKYRAYLKNDYLDDVLPTLTLGTNTFVPGAVDSVLINGMLEFYHAPSNGLRLKRTFCPSMTERLFVESWNLTNTTDSLLTIHCGHTDQTFIQQGLLGQYKRQVDSDAPEMISIQPGESVSFGIYFKAYWNEEPTITSTVNEVLKSREQFLLTMKENLVFETPDPVLNHLFYFSKIRAAESIYSTSMGLVHSPGGGRYYTGVWANDQAEYSGPFFPYLGYDIGNEAALNAYRVFLNNIPEGDGHFWSSFEMNGELTCCGADRGDAAMIAFGAAHFVLTNGNKQVAQELWPLIEWSLDYCERQKNESGVIASDTDEMEGRIPTGDANLSTSSLYYGALLLAIDLGKELNIKSKQLKLYKKEADQLAKAMESYFGASIEDLDTYRYFEGHDHLRHWICLPLVMGINDRKEGTLEALFSKLWTNNGVRVEYNPDLVEPDLFWDRGTLYAFRGAFKAGATDRGLDKLTAYSQTRLLGFHVPYVVEAWPEGNMAHLSAESALYCRIITEGLLGINPIGFNGFEISPHLPVAWDQYKLTSIRAFDSEFDISVKREGEKIRLIILEGEKELFNKVVDNGELLHIKL